MTDVEAELLSSTEDPLLHEAHKAFVREQIHPLGQACLSALSLGMATESAVRNLVNRLSV
jgi:hypothetical protein